MAPSNPADSSEIMIPTEIESGLPKPCRPDEPKTNMYNRLMDDLEDEDEKEKEEEEENGPRGPWAKVLVFGELVLFFGLVAALAVMKMVGGVKDQKFKNVKLLYWVVLVMVLVSGLSVVRFATFLVFTLVKWRWRVHRYVVYIVEEIKCCVDMTLWSGLVLVTWYQWFRLRLEHDGGLSVVAIGQTSRFLIALVLGCFLWTLKNALYLKLKADLHYDQLYDRIRHTIIYFHGIQIIHHQGMWKFLSSPKKKEKEMTWKDLKGPPQQRRVVIEGKNIWMDVYNMKKEKVPIWVLSRLASIYKKHMKKFGLPGNRNAIGDDQNLMLEAQQMLKEIIREKGRSHILPEDLDKYALEEEERDCLFRLLDTRKEEHQQHKSISKEQFLSWAANQFWMEQVKAYKNCWGLEHTLRSSERVFIKLNRILSSFLVILILIIWLLLSRIVNTAQIALLFSPFLAVTFIFGDTCKKMFEGLIFTFAMHPFDVGDRVVIQDVQMKVTQLNILTSNFFKYETEEEVVYPNSLLANTQITNLDITPDEADSLEFTISSSTTPLEDITDLELRIKKALDDDISYASQTQVRKKEFAKEGIKMGVYFKYLVSYLPAESKALHKSRILTKIMEFNREMEKNIQQASSAIEVGRVDFAIDATVTIEQIDQLKNKMFENYESYKEYSKILMKSLDEKKIEMVVYLRHHKSEGAKDFKEVEDLKQQISQEIRNWNWKGALDDAITSKHHGS